MADISPAIRRMTYTELGKARGIDAKSAERLVRRRRWQKQIGNDGVVRVLVPIGEDAARKRPGRTVPPDVRERQPETSGRDIGEVIREAIREVVAPLSAQLEYERARADVLQAKLEAGQLAEQLARAEAADLRAVLDAREQWGLRRRLRWALGRRR